MTIKTHTLAVGYKNIRNAYGFVYIEFFKLSFDTSAEPNKTVETMSIKLVESLGDCVISYNPETKELIVNTSKYAKLVGKKATKATQQARHNAQSDIIRSRLS